MLRAEIKKKGDSEKNKRWYRLWGVMNGKTLTARSRASESWTVKER